jgi:MFS transporter, DHA1 family, tetracycline resistance protein
MSIQSRIASFIERQPVPARIAIAMFLLAAVADGALMPFFALWALKIAHVEVGWIGALFACYAGGELVATPLIGGAADRFGRRRVLIWSSGGVGIGFILLLFAQGPWTAAGCLIIIGIFESTLHPTAATVVADVSAPGKLTESMALLRLASNAGGMVGPALGAALAIVSLRLVFAGAGIAILIGTLCVAVFLAETRPDETDGDGEEESLTALTAVFRDGRLAALLLPVAVVGISSSWIESVMPLFANTQGVLSETGVGFLFTYAGALGVVFQLPLTAATKRHSAFAVIVVAAVVQTFAFAVLLAPPSLLVLVAAITAFSVARMLIGPLSNAIALTMAPAHARATYQAAFGITNDLRDAAGPAIGTWLFAVAGQLPWIVGAPVSLVAGVVLALRLRAAGTPSMR